MKKKLVLKGWVQKTLGVLVCLSIMFVVTTADSDLSMEYLICVGIALVVAGLGTYLLNKYGKLNE